VFFKLLILQLCSAQCSIVPLQNSILMRQNVAIVNIASVGIRRVCFHFSLSVHNIGLIIRKLCKILMIYTAARRGPQEGRQLGDLDRDLQ